MHHERHYSTQAHPSDVAAQHATRTTHACHPQRSSLTSALALQAFLAKWKDEREVARGLLQQHSQWLNTFKSQLAKAAAKAGTAAALASINASLSVQPAAAGGAGLEALLSGLQQAQQPLGGAAAAPVRLQLGGNRELVISLQHK